MGNRGTLKSIFSVVLSNCSTILSGVIVGFVIPRILSVEGFGYYKIFTLYVTYLGLFSLGMVDGIVLRYGGKNYDQLDKPLFRCYFKWFFLLNISFSIIFCIIGFVLQDREKCFILIMLGINLLAVNISGYFQQISQITMRFKEYSWRRVLQSICNILAVILLVIRYYLGYIIEYRLYVVLLVTINIALMLWYIWTYREMVAGVSCSMYSIRKDIEQLIKHGIPLMISNICSTLILTLDRQFVSILFDTKTYAVYAFAYSMLALVTVAISAISTVLYPVLKRTEKENLEDSYTRIIAIILIVVYGCLSIYFPLCIFIRWFLPKYIGSLVIFRVIFPGLAISSAITIVMHNYYKVYEKSYLFFKKGLMMLGVSIVANAVAYRISGTTISISIASIVSLVIWYLYTEDFFVKEINYKRSKNLLYMLNMLSAFYLVTSIENSYIAMIVYLLCFILITYVCFSKMIINILKR